MVDGPTGPTGLPLSSPYLRGKRRGKCRGIRPSQFLYKDTEKSRHGRLFGPENRPKFRNLQMPSRAGRPSRRSPFGTALSSDREARIDRPHTLLYYIPSRKTPPRPDFRLPPTPYDAPTHGRASRRATPRTAGPPRPKTWRRRLENARRGSARNRPKTGLRGLFPPKNEFFPPVLEFFPLFENRV
jgi:hypothetical protein